MMRSLFSGVSGLKAHQTRMDVIGNNIANVNTTGFKSSRTTFADTLSQTQSGASSATETRGGVNPKQVGLGVGVSSIDLIFTDASATSTGKNTDLALTGNGLFVVGEGTNTYYTRNGAFEFDEAGNYVLPGSGYYVKGWMSDGGYINSSAAVTNINIPSGKAMTAQETTISDYSGNLNSSTLLINSMTQGSTSVTASATGASATLTATATSPIQLTMSDGTTQTVTSGTYTVNHSIPITTTYTVYDSLGNQHTVPLTFEKAGTTAMTVSSASGTSVATTVSVWKFSIPESDEMEDELGQGRAILEDNGTVVLPSFVGTGSSANTYQNSGYIAFDTDGKLVTGSATVEKKTQTFVSTVPLYLTYFATKEEFQAAEKQQTFGIGKSTTNINHVASNGASMGTVSMNYEDTTQFAGNSSIHATANGYAAGVLQSVYVDSSGVIMGTYSNGQRLAEAQVAIAQFNNPAGLTKTSNSLFQESNNSGAANIKSAADLGVSITASALEMSNVDVANEFSDMIITQRGFQSNSKIVTVGDEMLETVINMKR